jgi:hypothetical protein
MNRGSRAADERNVFRFPFIWPRDPQSQVVLRLSSNFVLMVPCKLTIYFAYNKSLILSMYEVVYIMIIITSYI